MQEAKHPKSGKGQLTRSTLQCQKGGVTHPRLPTFCFLRHAYALHLALCTHSFSYRDTPAYATIPFSHHPAYEQWDYILTHYYNCLIHPYIQYILINIIVHTRHSTSHIA